MRVPNRVLDVRVVESGWVGVGLGAIISVDP